MLPYNFFNYFQSLAIFNDTLFSIVLQLRKGIFQKLKRVCFLLIVLLHLKLKFDGKQNICFVFADYFLG